MNKIPLKVNITGRQNHFYSSQSLVAFKYVYTRVGKLWRNIILFVAVIKICYMVTK